MVMSASKALYKKARTAYYAGSPIMSDDDFDRLENKIKKADPDWQELKLPGSENLKKKRKVTLSQFMPSLGKCYPHQIENWLHSHSGPYVVMDKLDGSSVLAQYRHGRLSQLTTRGNGTIGQDISFLIPYTSLPQRISRERDLDVRMEAILPKSRWNKYKASAENPRNFVAGVLNRTLDQLDKSVLKDIDFVALGAFDLLMLQGLNKLSKLGFRVVPYEVCTTLTENYLSGALQATKATGPYEADGLVIVNSQQDFHYASADHPLWATAFKENLSEDEAPKTKVVDVIWQVSHAGRLTPKIEIEPVRLDGATITYCTVHNFQWLQDRRIGKGAVVTVVRSGGVIPKVTSVVKAAKKPSLPDCHYVIRGKFAYAQEETDDIVIKNMTRFLVTCGVEGFKEKTVRTLYGMGVTSLRDLCKLSVATEAVRVRFLLPFGKVQSRKLAKQLELLVHASIDKVIVGSGVFPMGVGQKRMAKIAKVYKLSDMLKWDYEEFLQKVLALPTFKDKTADILWDGIYEFKDLRLNRWLELPEPEQPKKRKGPLDGLTANWVDYTGMTATWTGYRNKEQERQFTEAGGEVVSFSKRTQILFYKAGGKPSSKVEKARAQGTRVLTWEQLTGQRS